MKNLEIIFVFATAVLTGILTYNWFKINILGKITLIILILASILIAVNSFKQNRKEELEERIKSNFGDIKTEGIDVKRFAIGHKDNATIFQFGNTNSIPNLNGEPLLILDIKDGKLLLDVVIRNLNGEVIAVVEKSTWTFFDNNFEYNNDLYNFELVTKGERKVFFQCLYKNKSFHLSGYFLDENGEGMILRSGEKDSEITFVKKNNPKKILKPSQLDIPLFFKYPREKYYGVKKE